MSGAKQCASCSKTVYPLEELKCLDKIWHKGCFKCAACNMTLNMKTYKGYDKQPYCQAHYPQQKHTQVADNPELQRIRENTKIQSNVKYHEEFERSKSQFTPVTDNPELQRALENQRIASNVKYRGVDTKLQYMEEARLTVDKGGVEGRGRLQATRNEASFDGSEVPLYPASGAFQADVAPMPKVSYFGGTPSVQEEPRACVRRVGSIADYDPLNDQYGSIIRTGGGGSHQHHHLSDIHGPSGANHSADAFYQSAPPASRGSFSQPQGGNHRQPQDDYFTEPAVERILPASNGNGHSVVPDDHPYLHQQRMPPVSVSPPKAFRVRALYDYTAQDTDEVSFCEGDVLSIVEQIDEGWMYGSNPATGQVGLLPANYVERA